MRTALGLLKTHIQERTRFRKSTMRSPFLLFLFRFLSMAGIYWLLTRFAAKGLFFWGNTPALFFKLSYGLGMGIALLLGEKHLFSGNTLPLLHTLPLGKASLFLGLSLMYLSDLVWPGIQLLIPLVLFLGVHTGLTLTLWGSIALGCGVLWGTGLGLGLLVLTLRHSNSVGLIRILLVTALIPTFWLLQQLNSSIAYPSLIIIAVACYLKGMQEYNSAFASQEGKKGRARRHFITYSSLARFIPGPRTRLHGLVVKELLVVFRNPFTVGRLFVWLFSLTLFPFFQRLLQTRGVQLDPMAEVAIYATSLIAVLFTVELSATAFPSEGNQIKVAFSAPVTPETLFIAKVLAHLTVSLVTLTLTVLTASSLAGFSWNAALAAWGFSALAISGVSFLLLGSTTRSLDVETENQGNLQSLLLEQVPVGIGMTVSVICFVILALELAGLALYGPRTWPFNTILLLAVMGQVAWGWHHGTKELKKLAIEN